MVHDGVLEGFRLSDAMGRPGAGFPPLYRAMVAAGENSGALPDILERLADGLEQALHALDNEVAEEIMALAIEMARRMVKLTLAEHPETVLETVRTALLQLPQGHAQIHLHPDDMALVRQHLGEQLGHGGHRLQEDARLQRGECRIDGQGAQVDATLETRWRRVLESIGHDRARWQVPDEDAGNTGPSGEAPA